MPKPNLFAAGALVLAVTLTAPAAAATYEPSRPSAVAFAERMSKRVLPIELPKIGLYCTLFRVIYDEKGNLREYDTPVSRHCP